VQILATHRPRGADLALADVEVAPGVRLFGVRLLRAPDGTMKAYARGATLSPHIVNEIFSILLKGDCQHADRN
jgi:hypothetical protein